MSTEQKDYCRISIDSEVLSDLKDFDEFEDPLMDCISPFEMFIIAERSLNGTPGEVELNSGPFGYFVTVERPGYFSVGIHSMVKGWSKEMNSRHILFRGGVLSTEKTIDLKFVNQMNIENPDVQLTAGRQHDVNVLEVQQSILLANGITFSNLAERLRYFYNSIKTMRLAFQYAKE